LLLVDMQNDVVNGNGPAAIAGAAGTVARIGALLKSFRDEGLHVMHARRAYRADGGDVEKTRQKAFFEMGGFLVEGTYGAEIVEPLRPLVEEPVFTRPRWSAFEMTDLQSTLAGSAIRRVIVAGADLPNAVRATVYDALSLNLDTTVVRDGTASSREEVHEANLADLARVGVRVDTCLEVIREVRAGLLARP
jgi:nicotinamidase-related amidase